MARDKSEEIRKRAEKLEAESAKRREKAAKEFSKEVGAISDSVNDLSKNAEKIVKSLGRTSDLKEKTKALKELNDMMSSLESQSDTLSSGLHSLGSSMKKVDKEIAEITSDAAYSILRNLRNIVSEENLKIEKEAKSAEETLKEARKNTNQSSELHRLSQEKSLEQLKKSVTGELKLRKTLESDVRKLLNASSKMEREYYQNRVNSGREKLSELHNIIERSMDYLDEIPEGMEETVREMRDESEELNKIYDNIRDDIHETLNDGVYNSVKEFCRNTREIVASMELDTILQNMEDQVDNFIETRRQILARTGSGFDREGFSDAVSEALGDVSYVISRNEMADAYKDFIKSTRIQNSAMIKDYISDLAAMEKAYGINADNVNKLLWQDANSGAGGKMLRSLSNVAAELENNSELYTSADSILSEINDKAELIYGIARGDVKRQKTMLKSVAAIQAIQETSANAGVSDVAEAMKTMSSYGTIHDFRDSEIAQSISMMTGMSFEEIRESVQGGGGEEILNKLYERMQGMDETQVYMFQKQFESVFGSSASALAYMSQSQEDLLKVNEEIKKSLVKGDQSESILAVGKSKELTSLMDWAKNKLSDNSVVKFASDFFGELDVGLANAAHLSIVTSNAIDILNSLYKWVSVKEVPAIVSSSKGLWDIAATKISSLGPMIMSGVSSLASQFGMTVTGLIGAASSLIAGIGMTLYDGFTGVGKSIDWLGEVGSSLLGKISSFFGGAIGGTGKGLGEVDEKGETASAGDVASNVGSNALKGAALGAGIGSFIPIVGTAAGAAIGGGVGAITGLIGGKRISNATYAVGSTLLGEFAEGLSEVPRDGYAYIHQGEAILTQDQADMVRADGGISDIFGSTSASREIVLMELRKISNNTAGLESNTAVLSSGFKEYAEEEAFQRENTGKFQKALRKKYGLDVNGGMKGTSGFGGGGGSYGGSGGGYSPSLRGASTTPGKISDFGDMGNMNEAEKKAWRVAMQIGADLNLPPEMFYAQIINESGRDYDWHYQENNLAGVKYAGQAGAYEIPGGSDDGGNYAGWNTESGYAHYFSGTLMAQDNFAPAIAAAQAAKARGESLDRIIEAYITGIKEGGYFSGDLDTYIRNVKNIAREAPTGYQFGPKASGGTTLPKPSDEGNVMHIAAQVSDDCTRQAAAATLSAYLGKEVNADDIGSDWYDELSDTLNTRNLSFGQNEKAEFENTLLDHFSKNPEAPVFLYQTGGAGSGVHELNRGSGNHATVIGRRLANGNFEVFDSNGGIIHEMALQEIFDATAQGGQQGMDYGEGNHLMIPQVGPSKRIISWSSESDGSSVQSSGYEAQFTPDMGTPSNPVESKSSPEELRSYNDVSRIAQNVDGNINVHDVVEAINYATTSIVGKLDAVISAIGSISLNIQSPYGGAGGGFEPKPVMDSTTGFISSL